MITCFLALLIDHLFLSEVAQSDSSAHAHLCEEQLNLKLSLHVFAYRKLEKPFRLHLNSAQMRGASAADHFVPLGYIYMSELACSAHIVRYVDWITMDYIRPFDY